MSDSRPSLARRAGRYLLDSWALGGLTRGSRRGNQGMYTGPVIGSSMDFVEFEEQQQGERTRALWSLVAIGLLLLVGVATIATAWPMGQTLAAVAGMAMVVAVVPLAVSVARRRTQGSGAHLLGIAVAVAAVYLTAWPRETPMFGDLALPVLVGQMASIFCLVLGRR